ncbi:MAG: hypothetical protein ACI84C_002163 [Flavobacteriales bacterium]|jgi:hypothetical protein
MCFEGVKLHKFASLETTKKNPAFYENTCLYK